MRSRQRLTLSQTQRLALNASLQTSITLLRSDAAGLTRYLEEQAAENPHLLLEVMRPNLKDWLPRWNGVFGGLGNAAEMIQASPSLIAHVLAQVEALNLSPPDQQIAIALTEALEPSGWLGAPLEFVAGECGVKVGAVAVMLRRLQGFEPTGIFARDLAECLRLQAVEMGAGSPAMLAILARLDLLATGDLARVAQVCGITEAQVLDCFRLIRGMNPKPGADFSPGSAASLREPDLLVHAEGEGWVISLNRSALPGLRVERAEGSREGLGEAKALERMVEARNSTLLRIGREILARQQEALRLGPIALAPMTMADLAEALDLHESTISRAVAGTSLDTPRGTWWLRQMFSKAMGGNGQPIVAAAALRHRLSRLVAAENPERPLGDETLAQALAVETGVTIARRTVVKYREEQGIAPAHRRRRKPVTKARPTR